VILTVVDDWTGTIMSMQKAEVLRQEKGVSLDARQSEAELACASERLCRKGRKLLMKHALLRGAPERGNGGVVAWTESTATLLAEAGEDLFGSVIRSTPATVSVYMDVKTQWLASGPFERSYEDMCPIPAGGGARAHGPDVTGNSTMRQLVLQLARRVNMSLLNKIAEALTGLRWDAMMDKMRVATNSAALSATISGSVETTRTSFRSFFNSFTGTYTAGVLATDGGKRMLVTALLKCIGPELLKAGVPGTEALVAAVEPTGSMLSAIVCEAAEKAERTATSKKKPAAPTETSEGGDTGFRGTCFNCGKTGHKRDDSKEGVKDTNKGGKRDGHSKSRGKGQRDTIQCVVCGAKDDHYARKCPEQTCLLCKELGHAKVDCRKSAGEKKDETKTSPSKYPSVVEQPVVLPSAPVLKVKAKIDGKSAMVGLDTYAGAGMVLERLVRGRKAEWLPTKVVLEGVADEVVKPSGQLQVTVGLGSGCSFTEEVLVVQHLPGDVEALVSFDTLKKVGLSVSAEEVCVGGEPVVLVGGIVCTDATIKAAASVAAVEPAEAGGEAKNHTAGVDPAVAAQEKARVASAQAEVAKLRRLRKELLGQPTKFGERGLTFQQLEARGKVLEVGEGPRGEAVFQMEAGAADVVRSVGQPPTTDKRSEGVKERTRAGGKKSLQQLGKASKAMRKEKCARRAEKQHLEFEKLAEELQEAQVEREWAEALEQAERARAVAAAVTVVLEAVAVQEQEAEKRAAASTTIRAVQVIEQHAKAGEWTKVDARTLLGTEQEVESVSADEFCMPELPQPKDLEEFMEVVERLAEAAQLKAAGSKERYREIMRRHYNAYCVRLEQFVPGQLDVPKLKLIARPGPPIRDARRPMNPEDEEFLREKTLLFDKMGLWEVPSPEMLAKLFVSNPVIVKTRDHKTGAWVKRVTFDFWGPNSRVDPGPQRVPLHHELADRARNAVLWDKDDGFSGYYQYALDEDSKYLAGVYTPLGIRVFNCMPMGINVAPAVWNTAMAEKFKELPLDRLFVFMDDFMRFTNSAPGKTRAELETEHLDLLDAFLTKVEEAKLKLKLPKAQHALEEMEAIGMMYGHGQMWKTDWTTKVVREYPPPRGGKQMERFLALGNYYTQFVDNFAGRVSRLRVLARKKRWGRGDFAEGTQERADFEEIKLALMERMKLELPDWSREFVVKSDWSSEAMGAALLQAGDDGRLRPIAFVSRKCTDAEAKVGAPDGEMLALVNAIKRFERFLLGRKFTAYVDQGSLGWLKDKSLSSVNNRRLQAAFAYLRQFQFDLLYRKSKDMQDVDALSRVNAPEEEEEEAPVCCVDVQQVTREAVAVAAAVLAAEKKVRVAAPAEAREVEEHGVAQVELEGVWGFETELRSIGELQKIDDEVMAIRQIREGKKLQDLEVVPAARAALQEYLARDKMCAEFVEGADGRLYHLDMRKGESVRQLYVPLTMRGRLVVTKHGAGGHRAAEETLEKLKRHYYWASIRRDVVAWIESCGCQRKKGERKRQVGEMQSMKVMRPGQKVVFDIFGPLPVSQRGNVYLLVMVDVGTREVMLKALPTKQARGIARAIFKRVYLRGMCPEIFQSDLAKEFVAEIMQELMAVLGAEFRHSSPYHPQTNTHVERYNKTIATQLSLMLKRDDQRDWDEYLRHVEYAQLVGAQRVLGRLSPLFLKGGWEALDPMDAAMDPVAVQTKSKELGEWMEDLQRARQWAMQSQECELARQAAGRDGKSKALDIDMGDTVWVRFPNVGKGKSRKLAFRMHGPYVVKEWLHGGKRAARLGHEAEPNDEIVAHVDRMVRKKDVPQRLKDQWKPIKLALVGEQQEKKKKGAGKKRAQEAEEVLKKVDKEVAEEVRKELDDVEMDLEKIVAKAYVIEEDREGWQYRVRFVGYGANADEWYWEEDLKQTAPQEVKEFNKIWAGAAGEEPEQKRKNGKKAKPKKGRGKKRVAAGATTVGANVDSSPVPKVEQRRHQSRRAVHWSVPLKTA
jgi:transposase InsO family protein